MYVKGIKQTLVPIIYEHKHLAQLLKEDDWKSTELKALTFFVLTGYPVWFITYMEDLTESPCIIEFLSGLGQRGLLCIEILLSNNSFEFQTYISIKY